MIIHDITSKSIGVKSNNGKMIKLIKKGTIIPSREKKEFFSQTFTPEIDYAKGVKVEIYEGENELVEKNTLLKSFKIPNLPIYVKNKVIIRILLILDHNGIFDIIAKVNDIPMIEILNVKSSLTIK